MALQKTGQISLSNIAAEKGVSTTSFSLAEQSVFGINQYSMLRPDQSAPHSISEFYGYNHAVAPPSLMTSFSTSSMMLRARAFEACGLETRSVLWHDGTGQYPVVGDKIYRDEYGELAAGWGAAAYGREQAFETNSSSVVTALVMCGGGGLDPRGPAGIE